jgi:hypothetical protein
MKSLLLLFAAVFLMVTSNGQNYSGRYKVSTASGEVILLLNESESGIYTGSLSGNNNVLNLTGKVQNGILSGRVEEESNTVVFAAIIQNQVLTFTLAQADLYGNLDPSTAQIFSFVKSEGNSIDPVKNSAEVIINNTVLSKEQIREIADRYGTEPKAGNYWYDRVSGLYGVTGYPSYGFMYPDHNFGELSRNASSGNTGVIVNGRELPQLEWAVWSYLLNYYIQQGSYWLDAQGNVGYEGYDTPLVNLFVAARQNSYNGKGSGGDNFWSTRFSAGNSSQDNSQGYVSVPGYGPVGYGF